MRSRVFGHGDRPLAQAHVNNHALAIAKGRNRDTAYFAILDGDWPTRKANFERWLSSNNFAADGRQILSLSALNSTTK